MIAEFSSTIGADWPQAVAIAFGAGSLFGAVNSLHCVGMCGPLVAAIHAQGGHQPAVDRGARWRATVGYHAGRAMSYGTIGGIAGVIGSSIHAESLQGLGAVLAIVFSVGVLVVVFLQHGPKREGQTSERSATDDPAPSDPAPTHLPRSQRLIGRVVSIARSMPAGQRAAALGLATPLLPCGLLYAAVVLAVATAHPLAGVATMVGFALGAVPMLTFAEWNFERFRLRFGARAAARVSRAALVLAALVLAWRGVAELVYGPAACCASSS